MTASRGFSATYETCIILRYDATASLDQISTAMQYTVGGVALGWWRGSVVERRSLAGELSLSCARPAADG